MKNFNNSFRIDELFGKQVKNLLILPSLCSSRGQKILQSAGFQKKSGSWDGLRLGRFGAWEDLWLGRYGVGTFYRWDLM
jgi:hypothetical protein